MNCPCAGPRKNWAWISLICRTSAAAGFRSSHCPPGTALVAAARNLALAEAAGRDIVAVCSACAATLTEANHILSHEPETAAEVNRRLDGLGLTYKGGVRVRHYTRLLWEDIGPDRLCQAVTRPLTGFRFAPHYGCHYLKPGAVMDRFDAPENPRSLGELIALTGAESVDYPGLKDCCGGAASWELTKAWPSRWPEANY